MSSAREDTLMFQLRVRQFYLRLNVSQEILIRIILSVIKICSLWKYSVWAAAHFSDRILYMQARLRQLKAQSGDGESSRAAPIGSSLSFNLRVANGLSRRPSWAFRNQSTIWGRGGLINEQRLIKGATERASQTAEPQSGAQECTRSVMSEPAESD